jgi:hypothetical protein
VEGGEGGSLPVSKDRIASELAHINLQALVSVTRFRTEERQTMRIISS